MSNFRAFPYRGSLLRLQNGVVQEVFHEPISAKVAHSIAPLAFRICPLKALQNDAAPVSPLKRRPALQDELRSPAR